MDGDNYLGGDDFDSLLCDYIINKFQKQKGVNLKDDKAAFQRVREAAEKAKIELDNKFSVQVNLPFIIGSHHLEMEIRKSDFERMVEPILQKTIDASNTCLKNSGIKKKPDVVLLVGGMTRMPKVRQMAFKIFGVPPSTEVNPDEAVACGAAIQADLLRETSITISVNGTSLQTTSESKLTLVDVTPLTLGIKLFDGSMAAIIKRNSPLPCSGILDSLTNAIDNATSVSLDIYQGESNTTKKNTFLGAAVLSNLQALPTGSHRFEVKFDVDVNGVVTATGRDLRNGKMVMTRVSIRGDFNQADMSRMIENTKNAFTIGTSETLKKEEEKEKEKEKDKKEGEKVNKEEEEQK